MFSISGFSQVETPPSLLLGLSGLTGERGTLDVALIAEIISEKQGDLKKEFLKRQFYEKLEGKSYVVWEYAYNSLEMLLNTKSKNAIEKELIEYAANLALVYSFSETYLQISDRMGNSTLASVIGELGDPYEEFDDYFELGQPSKTLPKGELWLNTLNKPIANSCAFNQVFLDLVYDVLKENVTLAQLGFFKSQLPLGIEHYEKTSCYRSNHCGFRTSLDSLKKRVENEVHLLVDYYYLIKIATNKDKQLDVLRQNLLALVRAEDQVDGKAFMSKLNEDIQRLSVTVAKSTSWDKQLSEEIAKALRAFIDFDQRASNGSYRIEDLYYLEQVTYPLIVKLVAEYGFDAEYLNTVNKYRNVILLGLLDEAITEYSNGNSPIAALNRIDYKPFLEILNRIYELDKASTYKDYLDALRMVSSMFQDDPTLARLIFHLTDFLEKFTTLDKEKNTISIDVEEIIVQLYDRYETRRNNGVNFYFSVGLNQVTNINYKKGFELKDDTVTIKNLSLAAEKIGVKVKLRDWKKIRSFEIGETTDGVLKEKIETIRSRTPIVSDVYLLAYGSGILYNITNTTTSSTFNNPIFGTSLGISFFNGLDLNLFVSAPILKNETFRQSLRNRQFYGFSFDVKIGEYLTRLKKKRAEKKQEAQRT